MKITLHGAFALALFAVGCQHNIAKDSSLPPPPPVSSVDERTNIAHKTCEAQYREEKQNYLSAAQSAIAEGRPLPAAGPLPLDAFRAEINAAYNTVVQRCKTHMHCLEARDYDEAACYMSASDRKDAERRFTDLARDLRALENEQDRRKRGKKRKPPQVNVTNTMTQQNNQTQNNDAQTGDRIEDQDVLALCGNAEGLLNSRCIRQCGSRNCRN